MAVKKGLGKGLDALFIDNATKIEGSSTEVISINEIEPNRNQPRKAFEDEALQQLADSIREHGVIQPILVRPIQTGGYQIIAGERRWRASRMAGLREVPVIIRDYDDTKTMEIALIENLQRENLNPIEEAQGYKELMDTYNMTQADVSTSVGKSRSAIANTLRLLNLPKEILEFVQDGVLSSGHARAILGLETEELMLEVGKKAVAQGLTVRDVEKLAKKPTEKKEKTKKESQIKKNSYLQEVELALTEELHRKVKVTGNETKGTLEIEFYSIDELKELAKRLADNH
ncbi:ParB/RepB/Spo0J family partition protein [Paludicola sp. MB14-C6]|uniref:ParB/RepB/Spo0J family partition protein n=1 Tax=Paludihabitans sp. MB14-C6 TaxID=3070656 RepID=UPI0027DD06DA|nr:ParB/RepB/Spo0J family partition protein [Paludicola sp. MB14-C6]WMJ21777.1 ParB/RepB/Spo0J family partition protein [Paludicola sp. MB14-C6]